MRKIQLFAFTEKDVKDIVKILQHPNAIFKCDVGPYQVNKNGIFEPFQIQIAQFDKNQLSNLILDVVLASHEQIKHWKINHGASQEQFNFVSGYDKDSVFKDINLWLYWLESNRKLDVMNVCCFIPFKILTTKHYWENGNKRTSVTTLMNLLDCFRFFLSFSGLEPNKIKMRWYEIFLKYLERSKRNETGIKEEPEKIYEDFYNEIFRAIFLNAKYIL